MRLEIGKGENVAIRWVREATGEEGGPVSTEGCYVAGVRSDEGETVLMATDGWELRMVRLSEEETPLIGSLWDLSDLGSKDEEIEVYPIEGISRYPDVRTALPHLQDGEEDNLLAEVVLDVSRLRKLLTNLGGTISLRIYGPEDEASDAPKRTCRAVEFHGETRQGHPVAGAFMPRWVQVGTYWVPEGLDRPQNREEVLRETEREETEEETDGAAQV